jgi:hypothetical protein
MGRAYSTHWEKMNVQVLGGKFRRKQTIRET